MSKSLFFVVAVAMLSTVACAPKSSPRLSYQEARVVYADLYADLHTGKYDQAPFTRDVK